LEIAAGVVAGGGRASVVPARAACYVLRPALTLALVEALVVLHPGALVEHVPIGNRAEVTENVVAAGFGGDET
jgi:hypothetical protein